MTPERQARHVAGVRLVYGLGGLILLLMLATALTSFSNVTTQFANNRLVTHTHEVLAQLERVLSTLKDAETGERGYLLTRQEVYLEPYREAVAQLPRQLSRLKALTDDNAAQQRRISDVEPLVDKRLAGLDDAIRRYQPQAPRAADEAALCMQAKQEMDQIRRAVAAMENAELRLLDDRVTRADRSLWETLLMLGLAVAAIVALLVFTGYLLRRSLAAQQQVENRIRAERQWLDVTLRSIGDAVMATDSAGRVLFLNSVAESLCGWTNDEASGRPLEAVFRIVNENTRLPCENPVEKVLRHGMVVGLANHTVIISKNGSETAIDDSAAPIRGEDGAILGVVLVFRDVAERRRNEEELQQSWQELDEFFENSPVGMHWMGIDGTVLRVNRAELAMLGYAREEYVNHHLSKFYDDPQVVHDLIARLQVRHPITDLEVRLRCKDGSTRQALISINALWKDGKFVHSRCFTRDITERKRAEDSLRFLAEAGRTLGSLVDYDSTLQKIARLAVPFFADFCILDLLDGKDARRIATAHADPEKERLLRELHARFPIDWSAAASPVQVLQTRRPQLIAEVSEDLLRSMAHDDKHLEMLQQLGPVSALAVPLVIHERVHGMIIFGQSQSRRRFGIEDIELAQELAHRTATSVENARLYDELREAGRRKDEFLAMLAHELRNPLAAIQYANFLSRSPDIKQEDIDCSAMIEEQIGQLRRLIDDLLDVSRITQDKIHLKLEDLDARSVIQRAVGVVRPLVEQRQHQLVVDLAADTLPVRADAARLEQMIVNLLANAAKYTKEGGHIRLQANRENGKVVLTVRDTGIGIAPEMLNQVFELFMQADRSLERSDGGLGIGLTVVHKLAQLHGGGIRATSEGLGKGSEFTLWLPAVQRIVPADSPANQPAAAARPLRILVVEDNVDAARAVALLLKNLGHDVRICYDGRPALAEAIEHQADVALLDLGLPGIDGFQLASNFRREEKLRNTRLIAISGYGQAEDRLRTVEVGFHDHLVKPIDFEILKSLLATVGKSA